METSKLLLILSPIIVIQLVLMFIAIRDWLGQPKNMSYRLPWIFIIIVIGTIGPILYFLLSSRIEKDDKWLDEV